MTVKEGEAAVSCSRLCLPMSSLRCVESSNLPSTFWKSANAVLPKTLSSCDFGLSKGLVRPHSTRVTGEDEKPSSSSHPSESSDESMNERSKFFHIFEVDEVVDLIQRAHAKDVCVVDLKHKSWAIADYFVIATGMTPEHLQRVARGVLYKLKQKCKEVAPGLTPRIDGEPGSEWVAVDAGSIIVHLQLERTRGFYDIEGLHSEQPDQWNVKRIPNKEVLSPIQTLETAKPQ